jgi:hypothetical protein
MGPTHPCKCRKPLTCAARGSSHQEMRHTGCEVSRRISASVTGVLQETNQKQQGEGNTEAG